MILYTNLENRKINGFNPFGACKINISDPDPDLDPAFFHTKSKNALKVENHHDFILKS